MNRLPILNQPFELQKSPVPERVQNPAGPRPSWLRVKAPVGKDYTELRRLVHGERLHTVCESASCPNMGECWTSGTATFMILGNICTRACRFCDVATGRPKPVDLDEPARLADAVSKMGLKFVVLTSVDRDDLPDGGAQHWANCIRAVRDASPAANMEVLVPDFRGQERDIATVLDAAPEVYNHNLETVQRLTPKIRSGAVYFRSLETLKAAKRMRPETLTKSGMMLGLGETDDEVKAAIEDIRAHDVDILTLGQYMRPSAKHHPVMRWATPDTFDMLGAFAKSLGFRSVESGPLVRSSYHAERAVPEGALA